METVYILNHYQKLIKENFCVAKETTKKKTKQKKKENKAESTKTNNTRPDILIIVTNIIRVNVLLKGSDWLFKNIKI